MPYLPCKICYQDKTEYKKIINFANEICGTPSANQHRTNFKTLYNYWFGFTPTKMVKDFYNLSPSLASPREEQMLYSIISHAYWVLEYTKQQLTYDYEWFYIFPNYALKMVINLYEEINKIALEVFNKKYEEKPTEDVKKIIQAIQCNIKIRLPKLQLLLDNKFSKSKYERMKFGLLQIKINNYTCRREYSKNFKKCLKNALQRIEMSTR